jgi:hypothetical protein
MFGLAVISLLAADRPLAAFILSLGVAINALLTTALGQWDTT